MNCLDHLHICKAECCKRFIMNVPNGTELKKGETYRFTGDFDDDMQHYLKLHRVIPDENSYIVKLNKFKREGDKVTVYSNCIALKDDRCVLHLFGTQPRRCITPNSSGHPLQKGCVVTENCLYKKLYEEEKI